VEPVIGHMKEDGKLGRNWLKGSIGDKINALLCGAGHNLRIILRKLRELLYFLVIFILLGKKWYWDTNHSKKMNLATCG
jgi:IS5 family transposase